MLSYCTLNLEQNLMNTVNSFQQYRKEYSELQSALYELFQQMSCLQDDLRINSFSAIAAVLVKHTSITLKRCKEREELFSGHTSTMDEFSCQICQEILNKPITLLCGHSFCCSCLTDKNVNACIVCGAVILQEKLHHYQTNITLSNILHKWHSNELSARALCSLGALSMKEGNYSEALKEFTKAVDFAPNSHTALVHRAEAYLMLGDYSKALKDAQRAVHLSNNWTKAHFVKAEIHFQQHNYEDALLSYLVAYVFDSSKQTIKQKIIAIVEKLVTRMRLRVSKQESERRCLKRRISQDCASPVPVKHTFCRRSMEEHSIGEKFPRSISDSCHNLSSSCKSEHSLTESKAHNADCSDFSLSHETKRTLDRILFAYLSSSGGFSTSEKDISPRQVNLTLIDPRDFECSLCFRLLHNPVCTPCGHMFCQYCIERSLDHGTKCPLCKQSIEDSLAEQLVKLHPNCDYVTNSIIKLYLPNQHEQREKQHRDEIEELSQNQPVFVCTIAYPSVPCPLHIFEPRYRLMLRRCLEFNKREFGMCTPGAPGSHCQTGTLLKVHNVTYFPDGRSVVECSGIRRFKTTNCHVKDGYNIAKLNYIVDRKPRNQTATEELSDKVYSAAHSWYQTLPENVQETITRHFGTFPEKDSNLEGENGPNWHWWVLAVMPAQNNIKTNVLSKDSFHERLLIMHRIFHCLQKRSLDRQNRQDSGETS